MNNVYQIKQINIKSGIPGLVARSPSKRFRYFSLNNTFETTRPKIFLFSIHQVRYPRVKCTNKQPVNPLGRSKVSRGSRTPVPGLSLNNFCNNSFPYLKMAQSKKNKKEKVSPSGALSKYLLFYNFAQLVG